MWNSYSLRNYTDTHRMEESIWHDLMWKLNCVYRLTPQPDPVCPSVSCPDLPRPSLLTQTDLSNADLSSAVLCWLDYNAMTRPDLTLPVCWCIISSLAKRVRNQSAPPLPLISFM